MNVHSQSIVVVYTVK